MTNCVFICVINNIVVQQKFANDVEIIANEQNQNYPIIRLTNNKDVIIKFLSPELEQLIGLIEFRHIQENETLVAFSEGKFDETKDNSLAYLNLHLSLLKMYFTCLWMIKDNSVDFDLGFLYFRNIRNEIEVSSNIFSASNFSCQGNSKLVSFSVAELKQASEFLKESIVIESDKLKSANSYKYGRITISNYFIQHARSCSDLGLKMTSYCSSLETLFSNDNTELSHKLAERVAHFLSVDKIKRINLFKLMKKAYEVRSKVVHGGTFKPEKIKEIETLIIEVDKICRQIMIYAFTRPDPDNIFNWSNENHEAYFLDLIMT